MMGMQQQPVFPQPVSFTMNPMLNNTNNNQKNISELFLRISINFKASCFRLNLKSFLI